MTDECECDCIICELDHAAPTAWQLLEQEWYVRETLRALMADDENRTEP